MVLCSAHCFRRVTPPPFDSSRGDDHSGGITSPFRRLRQPETGPPSAAFPASTLRPVSSQHLDRPSYKVDFSIIVKTVVKQRRIVEKPAGSHYRGGTEAARAYDAAVVCLRGPSAMINFPDDPPVIPFDGDHTLLSPSQIQVATSRHTRRVSESKDADVVDNGRSGVEKIVRTLDVRVSRIVNLAKVDKRSADDDDHGEGVEGAVLHHDFKIVDEFKHVLECGLFDEFKHGLYSGNELGSTTQHKQVEVSNVKE
ncbi:hypothetical protein RND71_038164 [Anisodus tanguticus]|uniref:AP2/ERF domain-containing protein n=1 Tax=Anisodus tanguticus TaxID=243964 RepID=A0AAE1QZZ4_9SOLA|nr:hypothetical protein RND71_038164 [Anisodus tanguticus]